MTPKLSEKKWPMNRKCVYLLIFATICMASLLFFQTRNAEKSKKPSLSHKLIPKAVASCSLDENIVMPFPLILSSFEGIVIALHVPDEDIWISKPILSGSSETHMLSDLHSLDARLRTDRSVNQGDIILDVGANIGVFSLYFAKKGFKVISFEPMPQNFEKLSFSVCLNRFISNVDITLVNNVVSNTSGEIYRMGGDPTNKGHSIVIGSPDKKNPFQVETSVIVSVSLDNYMKSHCLHDKIALLKIDVEGFEGFVIDGAKKILNNCPPRYIFIELQKYLIDAHKDGPCMMVDILIMLRRYGFKPLSVPGKNEKLNFFDSEQGIKDYVKHITENEWGDYLFIKS